MPAPPELIDTARLRLRRWRVDDAPALHEALRASAEHLTPWIPRAVAECAPVPELEARLARFAADFEAGRTWLYAIVGRDDALLGGIGLYPRDAHDRVPADAADRVEIGYWLRSGATGHGYATEATRAMVAAARALPGLGRVEVRCDPGNLPSNAVPQRLGFHLAETFTEPRPTHVWTLHSPLDPR